MVVELKRYIGGCSLERTEVFDPAKESRHVSHEKAARQQEGQGSQSHHGDRRFKVWHLTHRKKRHVTTVHVVAHK